MCCAKTCHEANRDPLTSRILKDDSGYIMRSYTIGEVHILPAVYFTLLIAFQSSIFVHYVDTVIADGVLFQRILFVQDSNQTSPITKLTCHGRRCYCKVQPLPSCERCCQSLHSFTSTLLWKHQHVQRQHAMKSPRLDLTALMMLFLSVRAFLCN